MKALICENKALRLADLAEPGVPKPGEVRVRVAAATVNPTDQDMAAGAYDLFLKLYGARGPVKTGLEFAGTVEEASGRYRKGDRIFGYTSLMKGPKTHQQVLNVNENCTAAIPEGLSFEQAASIAIAGNSSLALIDDIARLAAGQSLLINGASGGVGVFALQYAKFRGLRVSATAGPGQQDFVRGLGAEAVYDYTTQPLDALGSTFDAVLDFSNGLKFRHVRHLLSPRGVFVPADPLKNLADIAANPLRRQKTGYFLVQEGDTGKLSKAAALVAGGSIKAEIDSRFPLAAYREAFERLGTKGRRGRIILDMADAAS
ncbi:NADPH:quinone reductase-like Zn-dependent oxidoreductase [Hoeflea halophila]|uniref:NADPH:quinone reductase-like Zn-dependent oxidoreductase n=1 Tax=Hoeflea halophila TaxID=714899 RepID=A0A286IAN2_9HYPH|nr:NAD(P)-dependent alcohol dehydrogenase [Hoeflea halophila]SOE17178.1 NADPH:quinone reductase-like Zn-dependent oxidoreductase [Hoeflea halophila]